MRTNEGMISRSRGTNNILIRAIKVMEPIHVQIYRSDHKFQLNTTEAEDGEATEVNSTSLLPKLNRVLRETHAKGLQECPMKGHSFATLTKSPISSFFMDWRAQASSATIMFAWRARADDWRNTEKNGAEKRQMRSVRSRGDPRTQTELVPF